MNKSLQYRRVDKAILHAFIKISPQIPFEKMTVQDIIEEALISRYTFYVHFHDKYEVAERIQDELYQQFLTFIYSKIPDIDSKPLDSQSHHNMIDKEILEFCRHNYSEMMAIKDIHTESVNFMKKLKDYFESHYMESYEDRQTLSLEAKIYAGITAALMEYTFMDYLSVTNHNMSKSIFEANIRAMSHAIGLRNENDTKKVIAFLENILYQE